MNPEKCEVGKSRIWKVRILKPEQCHWAEIRSSRGQTEQCHHGRCVSGTSLAGDATCMMYLCCVTIMAVTVYIHKAKCLGYRRSHPKLDPGIACTCSFRQCHYLAEQDTRLYSGTVTFFIQTFFIRKVYMNFLYTGQSLYGTKFIQDKVYTGTKFIRGQSLYRTKFIQ